MSAISEIEKIIQCHLSDCLKSALTSFVNSPYASSNPVLKIFERVIAENADSIRGTFNEAIRTTFNSEEFKAELRAQTMKKLAQTIVAQTSGLADKQLNQLKQDPVFKANMTILINQSLTPKE